MVEKFLTHLTDLKSFCDHKEMGIYSGGNSDLVCCMNFNEMHGSLLIEACLIHSSVFSVEGSTACLGILFTVVVVGRFFLVSDLNDFDTT